MTRKPYVLVVALAAWMLPATAAHAATYCVGAPTGCTGTAATLPAAITAARGSAEDDVIRLGPGSHAADELQVSPDLGTDGLLAIVGEGATGAGATVLTRDPADADALVDDASTSLSDVRIVVPEGAGQRGLGLFRGSAVRISVVNTGNAATNQTGVRMANGATLDDSAVSIANVNGVGVNTFIGGTATITDTAVSADCFGIDAAGTATTVRRSSVTAGFPVNANATDLTVDSSAIRLFSTACNIGGAMTLQGDGSSARKLHANNVTVVGSSQLNSRGVRLHRESGTAGMEADVHSSFFTGVEDQLEITDTTAATPPTATFSASGFDFASAAGEYTAPGEPNFDNPAPGFVDQTAGDLRLRHDSFLVDRGEGAPGPGSSATDLAGLPREVDGNPAVNTITARRDIGAFEYQRLAPTVTATVTPASAAVGQALSFAATGGAGDPGESVSYAWAFDDGTNAAGASVSKSFTQAGGHTAAVTATDESGAATTANVAFTVTAPAQATVAAPAPTTVGGQDPPPVGGAGALPSADPFTVAFAARTAVVDRRRRVGLRLRCPVSAPRSCAGRLTLTVVRRGRTVRLGSKRYALARGRTATVRVPLSRAARRLLRGSGRLRVRAAATVTGGRPARAMIQVRRRRTA